MTFKRSIAIALALLLLLGALPEMLPGAQASPPDEQCPSPYSGDGHHKWVQFSKEDATCTQDGKIHYVCSYCDRDYFDPIPALGHSMGEWKTVVAATCTEPGLEERACVRCGSDKTGYREQRETSPAHQWGEWEPDVPGTCVTRDRLARTCKRCGAMDYWDKDYGDHVWGDGVVLNADKLLEEKIVEYTCTLCGATKTEAGDPLDVESIFHGLRNPPGIPDENPLVIVTQPVGGYIRHAESIEDREIIELYVEAAGGVPPYSYTWYRLSTTGVKEANKAAGVYVYSNGNVKTEESDGMRQGPANPDFVRIGNRTEAVCPTYLTGTYYCVVSDDAGNEVESDRVEVNFGLFVAKLSRNTNMREEDKVTLFCRGAGGVLKENGGYTYTLVGPSETDVRINDDGVFEVDQLGEYYFIVEDAVSSVTSNKVTVYDAEPLWVKCLSNTVGYVTGNDSVTFKMEFGGGVPPYTCEWFGILTDALKTTETYDTRDEMTFSESGGYYLRVTDSMGVMDAETVFVHYRQLEIAKQPKSGMLPGDGSGWELSIEMAEGEEPFTYTLYRDRMEYELTGNSFTVYTAGDYYFHVEDANGRWANSKMVTVKDFEFYIDRVDVSGPIISNDKHEWLTAKTVGGQEPITYRWVYYGMSGELNEENRQATVTCVVDKPGVYGVEAIDDIGNRSNMEYATVEYKGAAPCIIRQPETIVLPRSRTGDYSGYLSCIAVSGNTDVARQATIIYTWEKKGESGWSYCGVGQTLNATELGLYRCIARDSYTGKTTTSKEAWVTCEMDCSIKEIHRISNFLDFVVDGGVAPYYVEVWQRRITGWDENNNNVYQDVPEKWFYYDGTDKPDIYLEMSYSYLINFNGQMTRQTGTAEHYLVVTDASGQTARSAIH